MDFSKKSSLLDDVVIFIKLFLVDYGMKMDIFISYPLFRGHWKNIMSSNHFQTHSLDIIYAQFNIRHAYIDKDYLQA